MKAATPWWAKAFVGVFVIFSTITGGIYSGLKIFQGEIKDAKEEAIAYAKDGDQKLLKTMDDRKSQRDQELKLRDEKYQVQLAGISDKITDLKMFLIRRDRRTSLLQNVDENGDEQLYTNMKQREGYYEIERRNSDVKTGEEKGSDG